MYLSQTTPPVVALPPLLALQDDTPTTQLVTRQHPGRAALERYIHDRFAREYGADINKYMPYLIQYASLVEPYAAVGFRCAGEDRLFLETYLSQPVEVELASIADLAVSRHKIIEVGNLAATRPGASAPLFGALACFLDQLDFEWVVICATPTVQNVFSKLQIPLLRLADASREALPADQQALWGSYYQCKPQVMAVHVRTAHRCIRESLLGQRLLGNLQDSIDAMVNDWNQQHAN